MPVPVAVSTPTDGGNGIGGAEESSTSLPAAMRGIAAKYESLAASIVTLSSDPIVTGATSGEPAWFTVYREEQEKRQDEQTRLTRTLIRNNLRHEVTTQALIIWQEARTANSRMTEMDHVLVGLPTIPDIDIADKDLAGAAPPPLGPIPDVFPTTRRALHNLTSPHLNILLNAYALPTHGDLAHRMEVFSRFIGAMPA